MEPANRGMLMGAVKDKQSITADWNPLPGLIEGVRVFEAKNVLKNSGSLVEIIRPEWNIDSLPIRHVFQVTLNPGGVSAWHSHHLTTDRLFVTQGSALIVLYDPRQKSPTQGRINEFRLGTLRPGLLKVPPGVWHGVKNIGATPAIILNLTDRPYEYEDPDSYRLPEVTDQIPYQI